MATYLCIIKIMLAYVLGCYLSFLGLLLLQIYLGNQIIDHVVSWCVGKSCTLLIGV